MAASSSTDPPYVVRPGHGLDAPLARLASIHKVAAQITDGHIAIVEHRLPAGRLGAPLHRHSREDELSFVVSGHMGLLLGDDLVFARAGSYVRKPRGQWHTLWNAGLAELRFIELIVPGGFEGCMARLSPLLNGESTPDIAAIEEIAAEYGVEFDFESVTEICLRFGVSLEDWPKRVVPWK